MQYIFRLVTIDQILEHACTYVSPIFSAEVMELSHDIYYCVYVVYVYKSCIVTCYAVMIPVLKTACTYVCMYVCMYASQVHIDVG